VDVADSWAIDLGNEETEAEAENETLAAGFALVDKTTGELDAMGTAPVEARLFGGLQLTPSATPTVGIASSQSINDRRSILAAHSGVERPGPSIVH
jgi:hypothetical protein